MKNTFIMLMFLFTSSLMAQTGKTNISFKSGIGLTHPDSLYSINFRFRMQNRAAMFTESATDLSTEEWEFRTRRLRLRIDGFVVNAKLTYYVQLSFSRGDMDWNDADASKVNVSPNPVRDAMIFYKPNHHWTFGFGQGKLPGNRQRVISSGEQQFVDRSIVNAALTLDRDFGFFGTYETKLGKHAVALLKGAISSGKGRMNVVIANSGLCYTGRFELLPLGKFTNKGDYFEGDLEHEPKPKISICAGFGLNTMAVRAGGQLGKDLPNPYDMLTLIADGVFKYKGWAASSEFMLRSSTNQPKILAANSANYIFCGSGINSQLSYCFKNRWEVAARHALLTPTIAVWEKAYQEANYTLGVTKYLNHHRVKVQWNGTFIEKNQLYKNTKTAQFYTAFQIELGI
ncbi:MAG: porin [Flavobacteriaceae bacterium]|nr:porin [Flavobacteriaceae bacterium]